MINKEIGVVFCELVCLMEFYDEKFFCICFYFNVYMILCKLDWFVVDLLEVDLQEIKGIGKVISGKIWELVEYGKMDVLDKYCFMMLEGVQQMLGIFGFGFKKVWLVWQELGIESVGELFYVVNENCLLEVKGFG